MFERIKLFYGITNKKLYDTYKNIKNFRKMLERRGYNGNVEFMTETLCHVNITHKAYGKIDFKMTYSSSLNIDEILSNIISEISKNEDIAKENKAMKISVTDLKLRELGGKNEGSKIKNK